MKLFAQAMAGLAFLVALLGAILFGIAGRGYCQGWLFLAVFAGASLAITIDLARRDPALLARRVQAGPLAEPTAKQKLIQGCAGLAFLGIFAIAALDQPSSIATALVIAGDVLVALGLFIVFLVYRANTFTSATVQVERDQHVVSTGPYAVVRHPMYAGAIVMVIGMPLALASWWAFLALPVMIAVIAWRLANEERQLVAELPGYTAYQTRVKYRLVPHVW